MRLHRSKMGAATSPTLLAKNSAVYTGSRFAWLLLADMEGLNGVYWSGVSHLPTEYFLYVSNHLSVSWRLCFFLGSAEDVPGRVPLSKSTSVPLGSILMLSVVKIICQMTVFFWKNKKYLFPWVSTCNYAQESCMAMLRGHMQWQGLNLDWMHAKQTFWLAILWILVFFIFGVTPCSTPSGAWRQG